VDAQFDELKRLVHLQERRNRHLVDLKEAFLTATAAEKIAEITLETERLEEQMSHISYDLAVLNRAKMEPGPTAAVIKLLEGGPRARLRKPDGQLVRRRSSQVLYLAFDTFSIQSDLQVRLRTINTIEVAPEK